MAAVAIPNTRPLKKKKLQSFLREEGRGGEDNGGRKKRSMRGWEEIYKEGSGRTLQEKTLLRREERSVCKERRKRRVKLGPSYAFGHWGRNERGGQALSYLQKVFAWPARC